MAMLSKSSRLRGVGPRFRNNADVFAKTGNPWNGERRNIPAVVEPLTDLERMVDAKRRSLGMPSLHFAAETRERYRTSESPDFDYLFCDRANARRERAPEPRQVIETNPFRRGVAVKARANLAKYSKRTVKVDDTQAPVVTSAGEKAVSAEFSLYVKYTDGREEDLDRRGIKTAEKSFERYSRREDVEKVELWSYVTGECLQSYERKT